MALANLRDFADQPDIRRRAKMLIDVLLFEMAIHSHRGVFGSTHGRTYAPLIKGGRREGTSTGEAHVRHGPVQLCQPGGLGPGHQPLPLPAAHREDCRGSRCATAGSGAP